MNNFKSHQPLFTRKGKSVITDLLVEKEKADSVVEITPKDGLLTKCYIAKLQEVYDLLTRCGLEKDSPQWQQALSGKAFEFENNSIRLIKSEVPQNPN